MIQFVNIFPNFAIVFGSMLLAAHYQLKARPVCSATAIQKHDVAIIMVLLAPNISSRHSQCAVQPLYNSMMLL